MDDSDVLTVNRIDRAKLKENLEVFAKNVRLMCIVGTPASSMKGRSRKFQNLAKTSEELCFDF